MTITISGGEPLLALHRVKEIVTIADASRSPTSRINWQVLTNGLLLAGEPLVFLKAHEFKIRLSFDGVPPAQSLRGRGTFERLDALVRLLRTHHRRLFSERLEISMIVSPRTIAHLPASVEYFLDQRVKTIDLAPAIGAPDWRIDQLGEFDTAFRRVWAMALRHYHRTADVPLTILRKKRPDVAEAQTDWICTGPDPESLTLDVNGVAYGCALATASYQPFGATPSPQVEALKVGRPDDPQFDERLAQMPERARASGAFDHAEGRYSSYRRCADCEYLGRCVICPLATTHGPAPADPDRVPDFLCAFNMVTLKYRDRFPCQVDGFDLLTGAVPFPRLDV